jgi:hypothetical protein
LLRDTHADFWQAALADAAKRGLGVKDYLTAASHACSTFVNSGVLHNREEVKLALRTVLEATGQFALFLGGKNVGKSLLLKDLSRASIIGVDDVRRAVVKIDARTCGTNLTDGLGVAISNEEREQKRAGVCSGPWRPQESREPQHQSLWAALKSVSHKIKLAASSPNMALLDQVIKIVDDNNMYLCLIIDEGNLALPTPPTPGSIAVPLSERKVRELEETQALLNRLVELTKQSRRINVLLAVSEYGYPYRLRTGDFFNTANFTKVIFAGEVPPADMRVLLQEKWALGPRLADVFLAYYGGHVHMASQALFELATSLDKFECQSVDLIPGAVSACLNSSSDHARAALVLQDMAVSGYAPVYVEEDRLAHLIAEKNVGGLVRSRATVVGTPLDLRTASDAKFGIVPSSHFLRHIIAEALYYKAKADAAATAEKAKADAAVAAEKAKADAAAVAEKAKAGPWKFWW